jgi:hypothetical protein
MLHQFVRIDSGAGMVSQIGGQMDINRQLLRDDAGVTLLELMFASGILAMALAIIFGSLISVSALGQINENRAVAQQQLATVTEDLRSVPYEELNTYVPPEMNKPGYVQQVEVALLDANGDPVTLPLPTGVTLSSFPNPAEILVTLRWVEDNGRAWEMKSLAIKER